MIVGSWAIAASLLLVSAGGQGTTSVAQTARAADLEKLREWVSTEASLDDDAEKRANARIEELLSKDAPKSEAAFYLEVASVVGMADNGHSNLSTGPIYEWGLLPIRTYWFDDGLYIVRARGDHRDLLGSRIESIAGRKPEELATALEPFHGGTLEYLRFYFSVPYLISAPLLHAAGLAPNADSLQLTVTLPSGETKQSTLETDRASTAPGRSRPWNRLFPSEGVSPDADTDDGTDGRATEWVTFEPASIPFAYEDLDRAFRYHFWDERKVSYIQFRSNIDAGGVRVVDFVREVKEKLERDQPTAIVLDNRMNPGGDLTRTAMFALDLPKLIPEHGRIFVLTSNGTFSAGIYTSFFPKATDPERTIIVGQHVGDRTRFAAESRGPVVLPESGYRIGVSLQMHDIGEGCPTPRVCHLGGRGRLDIAVGSLDPDVIVATDFAHHAQGEDPVLEQAFKMAAKIVDR